MSLYLLKYRVSFDAQDPASYNFTSNDTLLIKAPTKDMAYLLALCALFADVEEYFLEGNCDHIMKELHPALSVHSAFINAMRQIDQGENDHWREYVFCPKQLHAWLNMHSEREIRMDELNIPLHHDLAVTDIDFSIEDLAIPESPLRPKPPLTEDFYRIYHAHMPSQTRDFTQYAKIFNYYRMLENLKEAHFLYQILEK